MAQRYRPQGALAVNALTHHTTVPWATRNKRPSISCVLPAFNEAENLPDLLEELVAQLQGLSDIWEIVVIDDGSTDATPLLMWDFSQRHPGVRCLRLSRNFGKEAALTAGIDHALGEVVVLMDADRQHPTDLVTHMLAAWQQGADTVCAARSSRTDEPWSKRLGTWLFYRFVNAHTDVMIPVNAGDYRLMDRRVVEALKSLPERNRFMKGLYAWVGFRTEVIEYIPLARGAGKSSFSWQSLARLAFTGLTAFTNTPLRLWSGLGMVIALCAISYGAWVVTQSVLWGISVPGWATLVCGLMFFSGIQLLSIGILGEYVGRIFDEVKHRPIYLVQSESGRSALQKAPSFHSQQ
jgi:polyisoprenyl-phosphate glycosyltransferase